MSVLDLPGNCSIGASLASKVRLHRSVELTADGAVMPLSPSIIYGSGSDGDVTITSKIIFARDMFYENLTVQGCEIETNGFRLFVRGTLTLSDAIIVNQSFSDSSTLTGPSPSIDGQTLTTSNTNLTNYTEYAVFNLPPWSFVKDLVPSCGGYINSVTTPLVVGADNTTEFNNYPYFSTLFRPETYRDAGDSTLIGGGISGYSGEIYIGTFIPVVSTIYATIVSGAGGRSGGTIVILARKIVVTSNSIISARGSNGGRVSIGGQELDGSNDYGIAIAALSAAGIFTNVFVGSGGGGSGGYVTLVGDSIEGGNNLSIDVSGGDTGPDIEVNAPSELTLNPGRVSSAGHIYTNLTGINKVASPGTVAFPLITIEAPVGVGSA